MFIMLSLVVCIVGLLMYAMAKTNEQVRTVGYAMFCCGLLAFLLTGPGNQWIGTLGRH